MDKATKSLSNYISNNGITIKFLSDNTDIPYPVLYASLSKTNGNRSLRASEMLKLCKLLKVDPFSFGEEA